jgi:hypothetical protein
MHFLTTCYILMLWVKVSGRPRSVTDKQCLWGGPQSFIIHSVSNFTVDNTSHMRPAGRDLLFTALIDYATLAVSHEVHTEAHRHDPSFGYIITGCFRISRSCTETRSSWRCVCVYMKLFTVHWCCSTLMSQHTESQYTDVTAHWCYCTLMLQCKGGGKQTSSYHTKCWVRMGTLSLARLVQSTPLRPVWDPFNVALPSTSKFSNYNLLLSGF